LWRFILPKEELKDDSQETQYSKEQKPKLLRDYLHYSLLAKFVEVLQQNA